MSEYLSAASKSLDGSSSRDWLPPVPDTQSKPPLDASRSSPALPPLSTPPAPSVPPLGTSRAHRSVERLATSLPVEARPPLVAPAGRWFSDLPRKASSRAGLSPLDGRRTPLLSPEQSPQPPPRAPSLGILSTSSGPATPHGVLSRLSPRTPQAGDIPRHSSQRTQYSITEGMQSVVSLPISTMTTAAKQQEGTGVCPTPASTAAAFMSGNVSPQWGPQSSDFQWPPLSLAGGSLSRPYDEEPMPDTPQPNGSICLPPALLSHVDREAPGTPLSARRVSSLQGDDDDNDADDQDSMHEPEPECPRDESMDPPEVEDSPEEAHHRTPPCPCDDNRPPPVTPKLVLEPCARRPSLLAVGAEDHTCDWGLELLDATRSTALGHSTVSTPPLMSRSAVDEGRLATSQVRHGRTPTQDSDPAAESCFASPTSPTGPAPLDDRPEGHSRLNSPTSACSLLFAPGASRTSSSSDLHRSRASALRERLADAGVTASWLKQRDRGETERQQAVLRSPDSKSRDMLLH